MKTKDLPKNLTALYAQVMLHYRQPEGDAAWDEIRKLIGTENTSSFAFLMGWVSGRHQTLLKESDWLELQRLVIPINEGKGT